MGTKPLSALRRRLIAFGLLAPWVTQAAGTQTAGNDGRKVALVIGNNRYRTGVLKNPINDAKAVADVLKGMNFKIELRMNASLADMLEAMRQFSHETNDAEVRLMFYAGHGLQVKGRNYLLPVNTEPQDENEVPRKTADLNELIDRLARLKGTNIVILDACRNNPFSGTEILGPDGRRLTFRGASKDGLAAVTVPPGPSGSLIAFSTTPGGVALDHPTARNSLYTRYLLKHIRSPGLPIEFLFKQVRDDVARETKRMQVPWESSTITGDFCFKPLAGGGCYRPMR